MSDHSAHRAPFDALDAHLATYLGRETGRATLQDGAGALELLRFEPMAGVLVLVTAGAARAAPRREALLTLHADPPEPVLGAACGALAAYAEALERGTLAGGFAPDPDVLEGFDLDTLLILPPTSFAAGLARVELPELGWVELDWLVPGYDEELTYLRAHGSTALTHLFNAQRLDLQDFHRGPASTLVTPEDAATLSGADSGERGYRVEQVRGGVRIERRRRKIGQTTSRERPSAALEPAPEPKSTPAPSRAPPSRGRPASAAPRRAGRPGRKRFDLGPELTSTPVEPEAPTPSGPPSPPVDPEEAKRQRLAELKTKALEARARAEARRRGEAEPEAPADPEAQRPRPEETRAVRAAERRRGRAPPRRPRAPQAPPRDPES